LALALSACVGVEREVRQKNAGLRTHSLVGLGAALFMLISKYGFSDVVRPGLIIADPSRMAAQVVSGAGLAALAIEATAAYLIIATAFPALARRLPRAPAPVSALRIRYPDGRGILRQLLQAATAQGFTIGELSARSLAAGPGTPGGRPIVEVSLQVQGSDPVTGLAAALSETDDVDAVLIGSPGPADGGRDPASGMRNMA
jgi:putative Mg2+ transporter-C (MgtC) family protein